MNKKYKIRKIVIRLIQLQRIKLRQGHRTWCEWIHRHSEVMAETVTTSFSGAYMDRIEANKSKVHDRVLR